MIESIILHSALNDRAKDGEVAGSVAVSCVVPRVDVFSVAEVRLIAKVAAFCLYSAGEFENGIHLLMVLSLIDLDDNLQRFLFLLSLFPGGTSEHWKTPNLRTSVAENHLVAPCFIDFIPLLHPCSPTAQLFLRSGIAVLERSHQRQLPVLIPLHSPPLLPLILWFRLRSRRHSNWFSVSTE